MKTSTHQPFLADVMHHLRKYASDRLAQPLLIFPTQLSIDYFQQLLDKEKWQGSATCLTLHQFILMHSTIKLVPTLTLVKELHGLAYQILHIKASFEEFYPCAVTLLQDFNDLDQYLVNSSDLFLALMRQKQLTVPLTVRSVLDQHQMDTFKKAKETDLLLFQQKESALFWEKLSLLYQSFTEKLIQQGQGYEGLCYRMTGPLLETIATDQQLIFVGFNGLTPAQEQFIMRCKAVTSVAFFWDIDAHYLDNEINVAGHYLRKHRQKKWFQESFPTAYGNYFNDPHKKIVVTEVSATVAQVQAVVAALQEQTDEGKPKLSPTQTAIVVSGTDLLLPLLDQLSSLSMPLHFRLNYPLSATVIYTLVERLVGIWRQSMERQAHSEIYNHLAGSLALLRPLVEKAIQGEITSILQLLEQSCANFELFKGGPFGLWLNGDHKGLFTYLQEVLTFIDHHFIQLHNLFLDLNKTALHHLLVYIEPFIEMASCSIPFFLNGLKESTLLFQQNNPLTGLYIVEVAEAYNLDFEHLFFMNMREGSFPKLVHNDSFLPYNLRNSFGLPLADKVAENVTAYGFYRLLKRAQNSYCSYTTKNNWGSSSEMSRLLLQLTYDSKLKIIKQYRPLKLSEWSTAPITIEKDDRVMALLDQFLVKEAVAAASITPSALISYLSCPLQFYFAYLIRLRQTKVPKDAAEAVELGTLFHHVVAKLYQPFVGMKIDKRMIIQLKSKVKIKVKEAIAAQLTPLSNPMLATALLEKLLDRLLELDHADTPFTLLGVEVGREQPMVLALDVDAKRKVWLSGIIDRIDVQNHSIRIIDYKTGLSNDSISNIAALFDGAKIKKNRAIFQLIFYAWLFKSIHGTDYQQGIKPYLIHIRALFSDAYTPGIFIQQPGDPKKYGPMADMMEYAQPFEAGLKALLLAIFDPTIPFRQTEDLEVCACCPYVRICQRN